MPEAPFERMLANLPPPPDSALAEIRSRVIASGRKLVVLDDDPTGTQTVHAVTVLTEWSPAVLSAELVTDEPVLFLLTNSRSLSPQAAAELNEKIGFNLKAASRDSGRELVVLSRSDSTLRGHFPGELHALEMGLALHSDGWVLAPYFREGGRYTIGDTHYIVSNGQAIPVGESEFARDPVFGYRESDLRLWVAEKSAGKIPPAAVTSLSIEEIRRALALEKIMRLQHGAVCIVNAVCDEDIEQAVLAFLDAEAAGRRFLYRTAASFVRIRAGIAPRPWLTASELGSESGMGGLVVVGSFVPKTTSQLKVLCARRDFVQFELQVPLLLEEAGRVALLSRVGEQINQALADGRDVLLFTSRELVHGGKQGSLEIAAQVSSSLVACVRNLQVRPRYLVAKGGITSSDIAQHGLGVRKARVLGQVIPGVPAWQLGEESRFPGMIYIVFPGNVGDENALAAVVDKFNVAHKTKLQYP